MSAIQTISLAQALEKLNASSELENWQEVVNLGALTAMRNEEPDGYFVSNVWRGPLLYSVVKNLRPGNILELGTENISPDLPTPISVRFQ